MFSFIIGFEENDNLFSCNRGINQARQNSLHCDKCSLLLLFALKYNNFHVSICYQYIINKLDVPLLGCILYTSSTHSTFVFIHECLSTEEINLIFD